MGTFTQKELMTIAGTAKEVEITLNRGTKQSVNVVWCSFPMSNEGDYIQLFRVDEATTVNQRDDSHVDSKNVLVAEGYLANGAVVLRNHVPGARSGDLRTAGFRVRINSTSEGPAYLNIVYDFP